MASSNVSKLKVCILSEFFYPDNHSGTGKAVSDIASHLAKAHNADVDVYCGALTYNDGSRMKSNENWDGIQIRRISYPDWNRAGVSKRSVCNVILSLKAAVKLLVKKKYDVILVTSAPPFMPMAAYIINKLKKTPYAYLVYDLEPDRACRLGAVDPSSLPSRMLAKAQGRWMKKSDRVVAIGRCMRDLLKNAYKLSDHQVEVVPVGFAEDGIRYAPLTSRALEPTRLRVVYSGNLGRYHDFDALLDCAKQLPASDFEFLIVGNGAKKPHVEKRILEESITNVKTLSPLPLEEYEQLLHSADVCFVTMESGIEGTCVPSKFYSIMAAGRPTLAVASEDSELALSIRQHECGLVVPPSNPTKLLNALRMMQADQASLSDMSVNARQAFLSYYTTKHTVGKLHEILLAIAGKSVTQNHLEPMTARRSRSEESRNLPKVASVEQVKSR